MEWVEGLAKIRRFDMREAIKDIGVGSANDFCGDKWIVLEKASWSVHILFLQCET